MPAPRTAGGLSPFADGYLKVELYIGGSWVDMSSRLGNDGVRITRGRQRWGQACPASYATFRLKNDDGELSPKNPTGTYYGDLVRNVPVRISATHTGIGQAWLYRGYVSEWPSRWGLKGQTDAYVDLRADTVYRRLSQGDSPTSSILRRLLPTLGAGMVAYWPCEDESDAEQFAAVIGSSPGLWSGTAYPGDDDQLASSDAISRVGTGRYRFSVPTYTDTGMWQVWWVGRIPAGTPDDTVLLRVQTDGTLARVEIRYGTGGSLKLFAFDTDNAQIGTEAIYGFDVDDADARFGVRLDVDGSDTDWIYGLLKVGATALSSGSGTWSGYTTGRCRRVTFNPDGADLDVTFGHLTVEKTASDIYAISEPALSGYDGDTAVARIYRLCTENSITSAAWADVLSDVQTMGPQGSGTLLDLLREAEAADGGWLIEKRSSDCPVYYRSLESSYRPHVTPVELAHLDNMPCTPDASDDGVLNTVEIKRDGGSSTLAEVTDGPLGSGTIGTYDDSTTLSLETDAQTSEQAWWVARRGTLDAPVWEIGIDLAHPTLLDDTALSLSLLDLWPGEWIQLTDLPSWLWPDDVLVVVQGYTETADAHHHKRLFSCTPALVTAEYTGTIADTIAHRAVSTAATPNDNSSTSLACTVPTGVVDDDVMIAVLSLTEPSTQTITPPAGWTALEEGTDGTGPATRQWVGWRAASSEPSSYTWSWSGASANAEIIISAYSGVDTTTPVASGESALLAQASASTDRASDTITTAGTRWVIWITSDRSGSTITPPSGLTERADVQLASSASAALADSAGTVAAGSIQHTGTASVSTGAANSTVLALSIGTTTHDGLGRYVTETATLGEDLDTTETGVDIVHGSDGEWGHTDGDYDIIIGGERMTVTAVGVAVAGVQTLTTDRSVNGVVKSHSTGAVVELAPDIDTRYAR